MRDNTNKLLELVQEGILDKDAVILALVKWMSDSEVGQCAEANELFLLEDDYGFEAE